jgi:hypothetical protein
MFRLFSFSFSIKHDTFEEIRSNWPFFYRFSFSCSNRAKLALQIPSIRFIDFKNLINVFRAILIGNTIDYWVEMRKSRFGESFFDWAVKEGL